MDKIKDTLWRFLGYDGTIEWDYDGTVISGTNSVIHVVIRTPKSREDHKWLVSVHPRALIDTGYDINASVGTIEDTDIEVCNWFADQEHYIYERLFEILTENFKDLHSNF